MSTLPRSLQRHSSLILCMLMPCLTAIGTYANLRPLVLVLFLAMALTVFVVLVRSRKAQCDAFFTVLVWSVGLSLLLSVALLSPYLWGYDSHDEYFTFFQVSKLGEWNSSGATLYNSVLSITMLPQILSVLTGLNGITVLKLVFPLLYSLVPVGLYKIYRTMLSARNAFLGVFLFMSFNLGEYMIQLARQEIAELLLVIMLWFLFTRDIGKRIPGAIAILILTMGFVTAHYSFAYVYLFLLAVSFVISRVSRQTVPLCFSGLAIITLVMTLSWYVYAAGGIAMLRLDMAATNVMNGILHDFFSPASRSAVILEAVGATGLPGILHDINRITQYLVQLFLVLGFLVLVSKKQKSVNEKKFLPLMTVGVALLAAAVIFPLFAMILVLGRFYHIALLFISPCFIYGVGGFDSSLRAAASFLRKGRLMHVHVRLPMKTVLVATILFSYFIFVSGWTWAVAMDRPDSLVLDWERIRSSEDVSLKARYFYDFTVPKDITAALWLKNYRDENRSICADYISRSHVLHSYGDYPTLGAVSLPYCGLSKSYLYLSEFNSLSGIGYVVRGSTGAYTPFSISMVNYLDEDRLFSDGGTTVYAEGI